MKSILLKMVNYCLCVVLLLLNFSVKAQNNVGIGIKTPNVSAILDITSTNKGLLIPRIAKLTSVNDAVTIPTPATSLLIYTTINGVNPGYYYNSGTPNAPVWIRLSTGGGGGNDWTVTGNTGLNANNFLGNIDSVDLVFRTNNNPRVTIKADGGIFALGNQYGKVPVSGAGHRFMWVPRQLAVRAGYVDGGQWDETNIGDASLAVGVNPIASGEISVALNNGTLASGFYSMAIGDSTIASGSSSFASGKKTNAQGVSSFAAGSGTIASGAGSFATGRGTVALGAYATAFGISSEANAVGSIAAGNNTSISAAASNSVAIGDNTTASGANSLVGGSKSITLGENAVAFGEENQATGKNSFTTGYFSKAIGNNSVAIGYSTTADANYATALGYGTYTKAINSLVIGTYNEVATDLSSNLQTSYFDRIFQIGAGSNVLRATVFSVLRDGRTGISVPNPTASLHIKAKSFPNDGSHIRLESPNTANYGAIFYDEGGMKFKNSEAGDMFIFRNSTQTPTMSLSNSGNMVITGMLTENSDIRLKEKVKPLENVLANISNIQPITYYFKDKVSHPDTHQVGFSAQEIEKYFPELVSKNEKGILSVSYSKMSAIAIQAIKEQQKLIDKLSTENADIKKRLEQLEKMIINK